ncbi:MAG TPA: FAD-binding oxidoreductase [Chloroflexi bacterium]|nr:FAD-binding oxidoreductase [Chloroflexota bacterium]
MQACVIGAGVIGCAVALELRRRGFAVTVIDKNGDAGHGSTSSSCGIVRRFYSQPGMIAMAHEGWHIWAEWRSFVGDIEGELIEFPRPGMVFIPPRLDESVLATAGEMQRLGIKAHVLSHAEAKARFPFLDLSSFYPATPVDDPRFFEPSERQLEGVVWEEDAGYVVFPALAAQNLRQAATRAGVEFRFHQQVTAIEAGATQRFELRLASGAALTTDVVVNVAGPHSAIVNRMAGVTLPLETRPLRREVHAQANPLFERGVSLPIVGDLDGGIYFRPESRGRDIIVGSTDPQCDVLEFVDDPDAIDRSITQLYRQRQSLRLMKRMPSVTMGRPRGVADLYDVTVQDWYPIVDRTDLPGYYVCIGTSGSSFKTAPVLGMLTAQIVEACESGRDTDASPLPFELPRIGCTVNTQFLSRHRGKLQTTATVIG